MLLVLFLSLTLSQAFGTTNSLDSEDFAIYVSAPDDTNINKEFSIELAIEPHGRLYIKSLVVKFCPAGYPGEPIHEETILYEQYMEGDFRKTYSLSSNKYGYVECYIDISYVTDKGTQLERNHDIRADFDLTYVDDKTRQELIFECGSLHSQVNYLNILVLFFIATTILFLTLTIYSELKIWRK